MKQQSKTVGFTMEEMYVEKLRQEAEQERITLSRKIRQILRGYLRQQASSSPLSQILKPVEGTCSSCGYFRQHYIKQEERYLPVSCGHCARPRQKTRKPTSAACEYREAK